MTEEKLKKIKLKHLKNNLEILKNNQELIALYDEYIEKIVELFDFLWKKNDDLFYTIVFDILYEIGFFSFNNQFNSDSDEFKELSIKPGLSIISGMGVCRNISCFYEDIFRYFYNYPLKMCCFDKNGLNEKDTDVFGNHMLNLSYYHDLIYAFDNMNHCLFRAINCDTFTGLGFDYDLVYKPYGDILFHIHTDLTDTNNVILETSWKKSLFERASQGKCITEEEYKKIIDDANNFITDRKKIFKSFLIDNLKYKDEINEKMLLLK